MSEQTKGDQAKAVQLKHGFDRDGTMVKQLQVRRPTWGDMKAGEYAADSANGERLKNAIVFDTLLQRCADLAPEEAAQLSDEDLDRLGKVLDPTSGQQTRTSSKS